MDFGKLTVSLLLAGGSLLAIIMLWVYVGGGKDYEFWGLSSTAGYFSLLAVTIVAGAVGTYLLAKFVWGFDGKSSTR